MSMMEASTSEPVGKRYEGKSSLNHSSSLCRSVSRWWCGWEMNGVDDVNDDDDDAGDEDDNDVAQTGT